jgi:colanic acid/amylovoran biosynthesis glycosyltransferase
MRVAISTADNSRYIGGPNVWLLRTAPELRKLGVEVSILFTRANPPHKCEALNTLRSLGFDCHVYTGLRYTEKRIRWILDRLNENKPDIFVPNLDLYSLYAASWIHRTGIPTIGVLRSDEKYYSGILDEFVDTDSPFRISALVCVSKYLEELAQRRNRYNIIIRRIASGTTIPESIAQKPSKTLKLVYLGRLVEEAKQISKLTRALCTVVKKIPNCEAYIYGSGPAYSAVRRIIAENGTSTKVHLEGRIENNQVHFKLLDKHVFVLLSDYEGLPVSLIEAMACGLVPISLNIRSGIPELIEQNITGILVNNREEEFFNAVQRLRTNTQMWMTISKAAREKIISEYSTPVIAKRWLSLMEELYENKEKTNTQLINVKRIELPPINKKLSNADRRWQGYPKHISVKVVSYLKSKLRPYYQGFLKK